MDDSPFHRPRPIVNRLFTPIFLFHGCDLNGGGVNGCHFEINTAIGTDYDLAGFGASIQVDLSFTFRASYCRHDYFSFKL
jgi:hypothetical protein